MILKASDFFDAPRVLDAATTPIPGSASLPLQVIAAVSVQAYGIVYKDNTGGHIGVFIGPAGHEKLICIIGNGNNGTGQCVIPAGARVSLGSLTTSAINSGTISGHLITI